MTAPTITTPRRARGDAEAPTVDLSDRRPRRNRRIRVALAALVVVLVAVVVWMVWFSNVLAVKDVRVVGVDGERATAVLGAAAIRTGVPLARVDTAGPQRAVAALPWVESVDVRRGWPNEIVLAVSARVPIAIVADNGAVGREAVDAAGVVFEPTGALPPGLPRVSAEGAGLTAAMAVLATLPADLARKVVTLKATTLDDVELTLKSGDIVNWGSADQAQFKGEVLRALMKRKADVYDVAAPELPTTYRAP